VDLIAAQGVFGTDFYDRSTRTIVDTMLWTEYRPFIKIGPKGVLGSHEIRPIHSTPSLGQSIVADTLDFVARIRQSSHLATRHSYKTLVRFVTCIILGDKIRYKMAAGIVLSPRNNLIRKENVLFYLEILREIIICLLFCHVNNLLREIIICLLFCHVNNILSQNVTAKFGFLFVTRRYTFTHSN